MEDLAWDPQPFDDGYAACLEGTWYDENPHPAGSPESLEWMHGWVACHNDNSDEGLQ